MSISTSPPPVHVFLDRSRVEILDAATQALARAHVPRYDALAPAESRERLEELFDHVRAAAATRHASTVLEYARSLAAERFAAGYDLAEVQTAINLLEEATWKAAFANLGPDRCLETLRSRQHHPRGNQGRACTGIRAARDRPAPPDASCAGVVRRDPRAVASARGGLRDSRRLDPCVRRRGSSSVVPRSGRDDCPGGDQRIWSSVTCGGRSGETQRSHSSPSGLP